MSENKNIESLIQKVSEENFTESEFLSKRNETKAKVLQQVFKKEKRNFVFYKSYWFTGAFVGLMILFVGGVYFMNFQKHNSDLALIDSTITAISDNNQTLEEYQNQTNTDFEEIAY